MYRFVSAGYQSCYVGETKHLLPIRIKEHWETDSKSQILKQLNENSICRNLCDQNSFEIIEHASSSFKLKLKKALHIV